VALEKLLHSEPDGYVLGKTISTHGDSGDFRNTWYISSRHKNNGSRLISLGKD
jgi:hypothetical protein